MPITEGYSLFDTDDEDEAEDEMEEHTSNTDCPATSLPSAARTIAADPPLGIKWRPVELPAETELRRRLSSVRAWLNKWPTSDSQRFARGAVESIDSSRKASMPWAPREASQFGHRMFRAHGLEGPPWPERTWAFMLDACTAEIPNREIGSLDLAVALLLARRALERFASELESRIGMLKSEAVSQAREAAQNSRAEQRYYETVTKHMREDGLPKKDIRSALVGEPLHEMVTKHMREDGLPKEDICSALVGEPLPEAWREQAEKLHGKVYDAGLPASQFEQSLALVCVDGAPPPLEDYVSALDLHEQAEDAEAEFLALGAWDFAEEAKDDQPLSSFERFSGASCKAMDSQQIQALKDCSGGALTLWTGMDDTDSMPRTDSLDQRASRMVPLEQLRPPRPPHRRPPPPPATSGNSPLVMPKPRPIGGECGPRVPFSKSTLGVPKPSPIGFVCASGGDGENSGVVPCTDPGPLRPRTDIANGLGKSTAPKVVNFPGQKDIACVSR